MITDKVFLEIFNNRIQAAVEEMANVVLRTGFTAFVKETGDFGTYLLSPAGETFGSPLDTGYNLSLGIPAATAINAIKDWQEGDIVICNDPYTTGGMVTHLPDIHLIKPYFHEGRIIAFGLCFVHSSDVGGKVPGSVSPTAYDIHMEGIRIAPVKLYEAGRLNGQVLRLLLDNSRIPEQNQGDLNALMAALNRGEVRLKELIRRYGAEQVEQGIENLLEYAELKARTIIEDIPDGSYDFWDYLEKGPGGYPIRLRCRMTISGSDIHLDFTGTDPQVRASFNIPTHNQQGHYMLVPALIRYFRTMDPTIPWNSGMVRMVSNYAPPASLLNPQVNAAVGARAATFIRVMDVITGALSQAQVNKVPAAGAGQACIVMMAMTDPADGKSKVGVIQPICGGSGARPMKDGIDGMDFAVGHLRNIPAETVEAEMPILIEQYGLRKDSAGAGRFRGGSGIDLRVRILSPDTVMTARNMERMEFQPWGRVGGGVGGHGEAILNEGRAGERSLGRIDELLLQPGDTVTFLSQGGGGYGDPYEREPKLVLEDVLKGLLSAEQARDGYGVEIAGNTVDEAATGLLRSGTAGSSEAFSFGEARETFEALWADEMQLAVINALSQYPLALRDYLKRQTMAEVEKLTRTGEAVTPQAVPEVMEQLRMAIGLR
ncbi:hydantoinase B/oxoprolinase family protein [Paenibacillus sp. FSL R7-0331]|uniref:hydantoinase B/oxoprolinase family protein n=1 Tax=Paenibacillus sp. FSL R7-0331 TaxID=1536773 RepID=UPI0004F594DF|nr:hydantoinase B/oxoprolinase family protein [Paenibacillus sp. FSL R7-0331]AIQ52953.1 hydantoin utilization protein B [Paenibacillus sp. FSL R7-0331]